MSNTETNRYLVPHVNLDALRAKIAKLSRKAAKLGVVSPDIVIGEHVASMRDEIHTYLIHRLFEVTVSGSVPRVATGHEFVAKLHHMGETAMVMQPKDASPMPEHYRTRGSFCDHCNTARRRNETFVLRAASGEYVQVGRSCLADFMPARDAESIVALASFLAEAEEECSRGRVPRNTGERYLEDVLAATVRIVEVDGYFVSRARAIEINKTPTAHTAVALLAAPFTPIAERSEALIAAYGVDWLGCQSTQRAAAREAIDWAASLTEDECGSEYMRNIRDLARLGYCDNASVSLAASIPTAYTRAAGKLPVRKAREEKVTRHVGKVGERDVFTLTVHMVVENEGDYGTTFFHIMSDAEGNAVVWRSSGAPLDKGTTYTVKATVKAHATYRDAPQTVLTRCAVVETMSKAA